MRAHNPGDRSLSCWLHSGQVHTYHLAVPGDTIQSELPHVLSKTQRGRANMDAGQEDSEDELIDLKVG